MAGVDSATRARVCAVAEKLGYVRDPLLASALAFARKPAKPVFRETLGFLAAEPKSAFKNVAWLHGLYEGFSCRATELGYSVECFITKQDEAQQNALGWQLWSRGIRGIAIAPVVAWTPFRLEMPWEVFAAVELGHTLWEPELTRVERYVFEDFAILFAELKQRGYGRIGLAMNWEDEARQRGVWLSQYLLFQYRNADLPALKPFEEEHSYTRTSFMRWLRREEPDVIIVNGPLPYDWLCEEGVAVPEKIGVCRIDSVKGRRESGLRPDYQMIGRSGADLLAKFLEHGELGRPLSRHILSIPNTWHEGDTLRARTELSSDPPNRLKTPAARHGRRRTTS